MVLDLHFTWGIKILGFPGICEIVHVLFYTTLYLSLMLVLGFIVDRYIYLRYPLKRGQYCSTRRAVMVIVGLIVLCLGLSLIQGYFVKYYYDVFKEVGYCGYRDSVSEGLYTIWNLTLTILMFGVVPLVITVVNCLVIGETPRIRSSERRLNEVYMAATTRMLLTVSFCHAFTKFVLFLFICTYWIHIGIVKMRDEGYIEASSKKSYMLVNDLLLQLVSSCYAVNLYIYILTGRVLRIELRSMFGCSESSDSQNFNHISTVSLANDSDEETMQLRQYHPSPNNRLINP